MTFSPAKATASLLALARAGDTRAFSQLMEAEQSRLLAQALTFCTDRHLAQDLVQETMIAAWKSLHRFDGSCRLFTWLYVILLRQHQCSLGWFSRRLPLATLEQQASAKRHVAQTPEHDVGTTTNLLSSASISLPLREIIGFITSLKSGRRFSHSTTSRL